MSRPWAAAVQRGIDRALNARGAEDGCAPLRWSVSTDAGTGRMELNGMVPADLDEAAAAARVERWSRALQLVEIPPLCQGTVEYRGVVDGMAVVLWAVVDRDVFEQASA